MIVASCNPQPAPRKQTEEKTVDDLIKEIQEEAKENSMDEKDPKADEQRKSRIAMIERRYKNGEITREDADALIAMTNSKMKNYKPSSEGEFATMPVWMFALGFSEPLGMEYLVDDSHITYEHDQRAGYNSALLVYKGSYKNAMAEAERIAKDVGIPLTESYQNARDLAKKLGHPISGVKGVTYMNYKLGQEFTGRYKYSISVDEKGKLRIKVKDVIKEKERPKLPALN